MSEVWKTRLIKYGLSFSFTGAVVWFHIWLNGGFAGLEAVSRYHMLCDAFTIPGLLELMIGALFALTNAGSLDGLGYVVSTGLSALVPGKRLKRQERFYDYVQRKKAKRVKGYGFILITGAIAMGLALLFLYLYYQVR